MPKNKNTDFIIFKTGTKIELTRLSDLEEFINTLMDTAYGDPLHESLRRHKTRGDFNIWLKKIGASKFAKLLKPFEKRSLSMYSDAAEIFYTDFKQKKINLSEVVGYDSIKERLRELVVYPDRLKRLSVKYGRKTGAKVLLYGPPGCGKSYLAKAIAGETSKTFTKRPVSELMNHYSLDDVLNLVKSIGDILLFLDEIESIGMHRDMGPRDMTGALLAGLDDLSEVPGVFIIAATNVPWLMDDAMIRSGRFDNLLYIGVPDTETRIKLFEFYTKGLPLGSMDFEGLAKRTDFYSCSDIEVICHEAAAIPWREAVAGKKERNIEQADFETAFNRTTSTALAWFEEASNVRPKPGGEKRFAPMFKDIERYRKQKH